MSRHRITGDIEVELIRHNPAAIKEPPGVFIKVSVKAGKGKGSPTWSGFAAFPRRMVVEAKRRMEEIEDPNDIEDLMREFSDKSTYDSFLEFREGYPDDIRVMKPRAVEIRPDTSKLLPFEEYDAIIVSFSGGKDSTACVLHLLDLGVPADRIELWHQAVDGRPERDPRFFDWPCTESYCASFAKAFGMSYRVQWREHGFLGEMTKGDPAPRPTAPIGFELKEDGLEEGLVGSTGGTGAPGVRLKFPAVAADLQTRWCSSILKIDVAASSITNDPRFKAGGKVLMVTGERRQESSNRAGYATVERHKSTTLKRRVEQWRAVLEWKEEEVWEIIERYRVRAHPAYYLGWGRVSCFPCIFGSPNQWASVKKLDRKQFDTILGYERAFKHTIQKGENIDDRAARGASFVPRAPEIIRLAMSEEYPEDLILLQDGEKWELPLGALGQVKGSTGGPL